MEDFVNFKLALKLKEKGFDCKYPFAMYDEDGDFYPLFTSCDEDEDSKCIFGNRMYYGYDDFIGDKDAVIAPTISQVLKWFREKGVDIYCTPYWHNKTDKYYVVCIVKDRLYNYGAYIDDNDFNNYESAALAGIEYSLDNLI